MAWNTVSHEVQTFVWPSEATLTKKFNFNPKMEK